MVLGYPFLVFRMQTVRAFHAEANNAGAARKHLIAAGFALRNSDWAGSIRESIHAVEAMAIRLAPGTTTLGPALAALDKQGHLHGSLKAALRQP
jgi:hypothetical protein